MQYARVDCITLDLTTICGCDHDFSHVAIVLFITGCLIHDIRRCRTFDVAKFLSFSYDMANVLNSISSLVESSKPYVGVPKTQNVGFSIAGINLQVNKCEQELDVAVERRHFILG